MDAYTRLVERHFLVMLGLLLLGVASGVLFSLEFVGLAFEGLGPYRAGARSLHISLMLYGVVPLNLALLPFSVCARRGLESRDGVRELGRFLGLWYVFLVFMTLLLLFGQSRGLPFYDYPYELNVILAAAGFFYWRALGRYAKEFDTPPEWWLLLQAAVMIAAPALLIAMHPTFGLVGGTLGRPRGDNTLGMSLALIPFFWMALQVAAPPERGRWEAGFRWAWMIPLGGYVLSLVLRAVAGIGYATEWILQSLSLFYVPLLIGWLTRSGVSLKRAPLPFIAIVSFLLVDLQGNLLFAPELRTLFHRADLVVGHAHLAIAVCLVSLGFIAIEPHLEGALARWFVWGWTAVIGSMVVVLTLAGFVEAGLVRLDLAALWQFRTACGVAALALVAALLFRFVASRRGRLDRLAAYHGLGAMSDGFGGVVLMLFGPSLYGLLGLPFAGSYQYVVFCFVLGVGLLHATALLRSETRLVLARSTAWMRILIAAGFYALFSSGSLGVEGVVISVYDLGLGLVGILSFEGAGLVGSQTS